MRNIDMEILSIGLVWRSMTSLVDTPSGLSYTITTGHEPINNLVSEIFSIKVSDTDT